MTTQTSYDYVIVGAGISGAMVAYRLGAAGYKVLVLEAGQPANNTRVSFMETFYTATNKLPEIPYPPAFGGSIMPSNVAAPRAVVSDTFNWTDDPSNPQSYLDQSTTPLPFRSSYERIQGGTTWHWLGTCLRLLPADFQMQTDYGVMVDWPISYTSMQPWYANAEKEIGVAGNVADQTYMSGDFPPNYQFPMPGIPMSVVDQAHAVAVEGMTLFGNPVTVSPTPAGRNSVPYDNRRVCAGNTNCIPICPIQAKYDATVTLMKAQGTGNVTIQPLSVASFIQLDSTTKLVSGIKYLTYTGQGGPATGNGVAVGSHYILATNAIETPKLLLMSKQTGAANGVANSSGAVGRYLMDHPLYLAWGLTPEGGPVWPYRGPLATAGIESLRDGTFRSERASFRMEIGNEGWNFAVGDPWITVGDLVTGTNNSGANPNLSRYYGNDLLVKLNDILTRQVHFSCLVEQEPLWDSCVTLSSETDGLGLPRPKINYQLADYTKAGFAAAAEACTAVYNAMGVTEYTTFRSYIPNFEWMGTNYNYFGAGHMMGTTRMGNDASSSVVNPNLQSWDHANLWIIGSSVFPTVGTANPTLTIAALALRLADTLVAEAKKT